MIDSTEQLLIQVIAVLLLAALLLAVADTPAYPLALGIEIIAILTILLARGQPIAGKYLGFIQTTLGGK